MQYNDTASPVIELDHSPPVADRVQVGLATAVSLCVLWVATSNTLFFGWIFVASIAAVASLYFKLLPEPAGRHSVQDKVWLASLLLFVGLLVVLRGTQDAEGWYYSHSTAYWLYAVPLFLVSPRLQLSLRLISNIASIAAVSIFIFTAISKFGLGNFRAVTVGGPVHSGVACSLVAVTCLALHGVPREGWLRACALGAALLAMGATVFTGTRGAMLVLPVACVACIIFYWRCSSRKENLLRLGGIAAFWAVVVTPDLGLSKRWEPVHMNPAPLQEEGTRVTGVGLRLAWYEVGFEELGSFTMFETEPSHWLKLQAKLVEEGRLDPASLRHTHLHNQWLDVGIQVGWVAMILVSLILFLPLLRFVRATFSSRYGRNYRIFGFCGLMIALSLNFASMTDCALWLANSGMFFFVMTAIFFGQLCRIEGKSVSENVEDQGHH